MVQKKTQNGTQKDSSRFDQKAGPLDSCRDQAVEPPGDRNGRYEDLDSAADAIVDRMRHRTHCASILARSGKVPAGPEAEGRLFSTAGRAHTVRHGEQAS